MLSIWRICKILRLVGKRSIKWIYKCTNLGMCYLLGINIKIDQEKGKKWIIKAANQIVYLPLDPVITLDGENTKKIIKSYEILLHRKGCMGNALHWRLFSLWK